MPENEHVHVNAGPNARNRRRLAIALALAAVYMFAEIAGGLYTNSLALLADAGHMFSDIAALALSLFAIWIAQRPPTPQRTYGYYRTEILAALANGALLIAVAIFIVLEAFERVGEPREVLGGPMLFEQMWERTRSTGCLQDCRMMHQARASRLVKNRRR